MDWDSTYPKTQYRLFCNCGGRNLHNDTSVIPRKNKIRCDPWHNKLGLRPTGGKPIIQDDETMIKNVSMTDGIREKHLRVC